MSAPSAGPAPARRPPAPPLVPAPARGARSFLAPSGWLAGLRPRPAGPASPVPGVPGPRARPPACSPPVVLSPRTRWRAHGDSNPEPVEHAPLVRLLGQGKVRAPRVALVAPCRMVRVIDQPGRLGFSYGPLLGHPEQGAKRSSISSCPMRVCGSRSWPSPVPVTRWSDWRARSAGVCNVTPPMGTCARSSGSWTASVRRTGRHARWRDSERCDRVSRCDGAGRRCSRSPLRSRGRAPPPAPGSRPGPVRLGPCRLQVADPRRGE